MNKNMKFLIMLLVLLNLSACTTYSIGKFDSLQIKQDYSNIIYKNSEKQVKAKDCITQFFMFPNATHDIEKVLLEMCPKGNFVKDVEIHEEYWSALIVGQSCTVATGICMGGSNE